MPNNNNSRTLWRYRYNTPMMMITIIIELKIILRNLSLSTRVFSKTTMQHVNDIFVLHNLKNTRKKTLETKLPRDKRKMKTKVKRKLKLDAKISNTCPRKLNKNEWFMRLLAQTKMFTQIKWSFKSSLCVYNADCLNSAFIPAVISSRVD